MLALGVVESDDAFFSHETGIDWDVIFLLFGMMIIVGVLRQTGVFEYIAIWSVKRANGSPLRIMILLVLVTAFASALLDNVTTVLLIAPVTLLVCDRLAINPVPFLIAEVFASNIGGASTLVGDPPNIIIASRAGLTFNDFLHSHDADRDHRHRRRSSSCCRCCSAGRSTSIPSGSPTSCRSSEREAIRDPALLVKCGVVLVVVFAAFIGHPVLHIAPSVVALVGAGVLILISRLEQRDYLASVEWETLLFFAGLFVMVGALVKTGVVDDSPGRRPTSPAATRLLTTMLILGVSAPVSGHHRQHPVTATMTPIVSELAASMPDLAHPNVLWWALALGADFGGNLTAVGASANVVMLGIARRADNPISFWEFTRKGAVVTVVSIALSALYLWLRYFVFG